MSIKMESTKAADLVIRELSDEKRRVLWGELPPTKRPSPLQLLCGKSGVFELIADFAGFLRGKHMVSTLKGIIGPLERALGRARVMLDPDDHDNDVQILYIGQEEDS